ncbi:MAG: hypothetical protein U0U25_03145 [Flavobacteriales bacterium]
MRVRGVLPWFRNGAWLLVVVLLGRDVVAQDMIEWDGVRQLHLSDFRSPATAVGGGSQYSLQSAVGFDFLFSMSRGAFMFAKNFNEQVTCSFKPAASSLVAPDSSIARQLVGFARYQFDLNELYARKFRQRMFEEKGAFSDANFFRPAFDELQQELTTRHTLAANSTDLGRKEAALQELHRAVLDELDRLKDFCRSCKPGRKRR